MANRSGRGTAHCRNEEGRLTKDYPAATTFNWGRDSFMTGMNRSETVLRAAVAVAVLALAGCNTPTNPSLPKAGAAIAQDSLLSVDSNPLPCCSVDSAGGTAEVVGGTLTFRRLASYRDTVYTQLGPRSAACITQVPNGAVVHLNGLVTLGDSIGYLTVPCSEGTYTLVVSRRVDLPGSPSDTVDDTLSVGTYHIMNQMPDSLVLVDGASSAHLSTALSWDTVSVAVHRHRYRFVAVWTG